jgi:putative endonuclease
MTVSRVKNIFAGATLLPLAAGREKGYDGTEREGEGLLNYVYILRCADNTLYTGSTKDLQRRVNTHNSGKGAKYTRTRRPVALVYFEEWESWSAALRREAAIKKLSRGEKLALIQSKRKTAPPEKVSG